MTVTNMRNRLSATELYTNGELCVMHFCNKKLTKIHKNDYAK